MPPVSPDRKIKNAYNDSIIESGAGYAYDLPSRHHPNTDDPFHPKLDSSQPIKVGAKQVKH